MNSFFPIILATLIGFFILAAVLLVPIYRFLKREEEASRYWTVDEISKRSTPEAPNGPTGRPPRTKPKTEAS